MRRSRVTRRLSTARLAGVSVYCLEDASLKKKKFGKVWPCGFRDIGSEWSSLVMHDVLSSECCMLS